MSKIFKLIFSRPTITFILIFFQIFLILALIQGLSDYYTYVSTFFYLISLIMVLYIINKNCSPSFKPPWITLILLFPIFGGLFYLLFGNNTVRKKILKVAEKQSYHLNDINSSDNTVIDKILSEDVRAYQQSQYISKYSSMPIYECTQTKYFSIGESYYEALLDELRKAQRYIFIEYYIIDKGIMWDSILDVLKEKVANGVEVRIMFDDLGTMLTLPYKYNKYLEKLGIKCVIFNPFSPIVSIRHNNRDHKKIIIIDGEVAFTGGINLADEYINKKIRFGHWKDSGIMVKGEAVKNFILMFLNTWHYYKNIDEDYHTFLDTSNFETISDGYVQPYMDTPLDTETVGRNVYINILNNATKYVYITTPYLIPDSELLSAIVSAAKRGIDVRIITPHVPDKWYVHIVTQSNYQILIESGVKIYEYTPGFIHAKNFISDDSFGVVGTINLDYRSLYYHFECAVWMYKSSAILDVKKDFLSTLEKSTEITNATIQKTSVGKKIVSDVFNFFAPML